MSMKLKALGLGLLAAMAMSAVAVMNAGAETGGHFVSEVAHTNIVGTESGGHQLHFIREGDTKQLGCANDSYTGTTTNATEASIKVTPSWSNCSTTGEATFDIHENSCYFVFKVGKSPEGHNTAEIACSTAGDAFVITHPNCSIKVPPQTVTGVSYNRVTENGKHAITLSSTVKGITAHYESGICIFLGTSQKSEMVGSVTVQGQNTAGEPVGVTAT